MNKKQKIIGVIGGMGPYASMEFYRMLLDKSRDVYHAQNNDDFPEVVLDSVPVPDFISDTNRMLEAKEILIERINKLVSFGCSSIGMVCNTGHILYEDLNRAARNKMVSLIDLTVMKAKHSRLNRAGVLGSPMTIKFDLYGQKLRKKNIVCVYPERDMQTELDHIIRRVLMGDFTIRDTKHLEEMSNKFIRQNNLDGLILGCTELPLVFPKNMPFPVIDCRVALSDELLKRYYKQ